MAACVILSVCKNMIWWITSREEGTEYNGKRHCSKYSSGKRLEGYRWRVRRKAPKSNLSCTKI